MAKVMYYAKENTKFGTHSFYAVPVPNGTLTFNEVCEEACRNTSIEPSFNEVCEEACRNTSIEPSILL